MPHATCIHIYTTMYNVSMCAYMYICTSICTSIGEYVYVYISVYYYGMSRFMVCVQCVCIRIHMHTCIHRTKQHIREHTCIGTQHT